MFKQFRTDGLTEAEKRYLRKKNGVKQRFAADNKAVETKPSDDPQFIAPYTIRKISKKRRFSGCRLSDDIRASVERKRTLNQAFHAALRSELAGR